MAFDQTTRNRLARFVSDARTLLTDEFTRQLQNEYGIDPTSGDVADLSKLGHLDDSRQETARLLRDTMQHYLASADTSTAAKAKKARQDVLDRIVREQAFTVLNRLCALRMAEARELLIESVAKGYHSKGYQLYSRLAGIALGETGVAYRCYLFSVFDEFAVDFPVLFDRFSPQGRLFPRESVLLTLLDLINDSDLESLWPEDETIGWVYQYFNTPEERRQMRAESQAPRNSRELAVRNQFFTPRYVVEFLTDNTLGRIWYEMTQGQTSLKDTCRFLVRRPDEVFLSAMTDPDAAYPAEGSIRMAKLLQEGMEEDWPEFDAGDESIQSMIDMAHCVDGYARHPHGDGWDEWFAAITETLQSGRLASLSTKDLLDGLFMTCRADRHGGDGSVYSEDWFITACNEVRRRALKSREPDLSQEALLQQPVFIPYRPMKDPRGIKMLDPACGSMHFGLYAFDLLERIYSEYFSGRLTPSDEESDEVSESKDDRPQSADYPHLIIERNIHGIDIDPRAVQIAGLSLWLRAQRAWRDMGIKAQERPGIERSNVVCAEPMPGDETLLDEFLKSLQRDRLESLIRRVLGVPENQQIRATERMAEALCGLVKTVWHEMKLAGEAGSLLKIEDALRDAIAAGKEEWEEKLPLFRITEFGLDGEAPKTKYMRTIPGEEQDFWNRAEAIVLAALEAYAKQAENGGGFQRRLFARDAARGFAFIDVCRKRYDVVLMNPPFGDAALPTRQYIAATYSIASADLGAACVLSWLGRLVDGGRLGAITNRTLLAVQGFSNWRAMILGSYWLESLVDLGHGVLDAMVETAMYVCSRSASQLRKHDRSAFLGLLDSGAKSSELSDSFSGSAAGFDWKSPLEFAVVPGAPIAYWVPSSLLRRFADNEQTFLGREGTVCPGTQTSDDFRFYRLRWEVPITSINVNAPRFDGLFTHNEWAPLAKGGEYAVWWDDIHLVQRWKRDGREIKNFVDESGKQKSYPKNLDRMFQKGATYPYRTTSSFGLRFLPAGVASSLGGWAIFPPDNMANEEVLSSYNTRIARYFMEVLLGQGDSSASGTAARNHVAAAIGGIPWPASSPLQVETSVRELIDLTATSGLDETALFFSGTRKFARNLPSFESMVSAWWQAQCDDWQRIADLYLSTEKRVIAAYALNDEELEAIAEAEGRSLADYPLSDVDISAIAELFGASIEDLTDRAKKACGAKRYIVKKAYFVHRVIDLACHILHVHPRSVINAARRGGPIACGAAPEFAAALISWVIGRSIGRFVSQVSDEILGPSQLDHLPQRAIEDSGEGLATWVDDASNAMDFERLVRRELKSIWSNSAEDIEGSICQALGASNLREYLCKPNTFFSDHVSRYSKSRRQAPIYWPLSTPSNSYALWLYYHRLTDQTLYTCVNDFVDPKLKQVAGEAERLRWKIDRSRDDERELEQLTDLERELADLRDELLRLARFWKPNLNDGVQITAAPLWQLFQHRAWRRKLKETWERLEAGDYDWAHLAMSTWPARVVPKCVNDRSLAIAHDLEDPFWVEDVGQAASLSTGRGRRRSTTTESSNPIDQAHRIGDWRNLCEPDQEIEEQKRRQRKPARDRVRNLFETMTSDHGHERTGDVYDRLASGEWDDRPLALLVWPERVAEKCWDDANLAAKLKVKLPDRRTKANRKRFVEGLVANGCPDLADQLSAALECHDEAFQELWNELAGGARDDQPLALSLWPDRVVEKCTEDFELAQSHGIYRFFWVQHPTDSWRRRKSPDVEGADEIARRQGKAVEEPS